jgi:hypothetical protein
MKGSSFGTSTGAQSLLISGFMETTDLTLAVYSLGDVRVGTRAVLIFTALS